MRIAGVRLPTNAKWRERRTKSLLAIVIRNLRRASVEMWREYGAPASSPWKKPR